MIKYFKEIFSIIIIVGVFVEQIP